MIWVKDLGSLSLIISISIHKKESKIDSRYINKTVLRSSHLQIYYKIEVIKIFAKFTRKHLCWSLRPTSLSKIDPKTGLSLWIFSKFLRTAFFIEQFPWLLLNSWKLKNILMLMCSIWGTFLFMLKLAEIKVQILFSIYLQI